MQLHAVSLYSYLVDILANPCKGEGACTIHTTLGTERFSERFSLIESLEIELPRHGANGHVWGELSVDQLVTNMGDDKTTLDYVRAPLSVSYKPRASPVLESITSET